MVSADIVISISSWGVLCYVVGVYLGHWHGRLAERSEKPTPEADR